MRTLPFSQNDGNATSTPAARQGKATEYHVAVSGDDALEGSAQAPFRTIQRAAEAAQPGDTITVHAGTYREWVNPPRGGESDTRRIVYQAALGERAIIKGSEAVKGWQPVPDAPGAWCVTLPSAFFGDYNPFADLLRGDWLHTIHRTPHTGEVYLNGHSFYEKPCRADVLRPFPIVTEADPAGSTQFWFSEVTEGETTLWANFGEADPNAELVEIHVRPTCFYPTRQGVNYLTLRGFTISQAATQWAAPTAEQVGMVATHWNKGWIIEDNILTDSKCNAITLGKERSSGHNVWAANPAKDGSVHYIEVIFNALRAGWSRENIGSHIVRRNRIARCEQTGICGSMGCAFSEITDNEITDIWVKQQFCGAEIAAIKFHGAIDTVIARNRLCRSLRGLWLDWMTQGTRVSANLFHDNFFEDLFVEVNHGPFVVDNNLLLTRGVNLKDESTSGAYLHNLFGGAISVVSDDRFTPYHLPHSTEIAGLSRIEASDNRFLNNLFLGAEIRTIEVRERYARCGLCCYDSAKHPPLAAGNVYYHGASPCAAETDVTEAQAHDPRWSLTEEPDGWYLAFTIEHKLLAQPRATVTTQRLGVTQTSNLQYENADGSPLCIDEDFLGQARKPANPMVGAIEDLTPGANRIKVWSRGKPCPRP